MAANRGWWSLSLEGIGHHELNQIDLEHIAELIVNGYNTGEIAKDEERSKMPTYRIVRFFRPDKQKTQPKNLPTGLTLEEAQKHCDSDATHGEAWFDGYTEE